jgi:hypothetical protein
MPNISLMSPTRRYDMVKYQIFIEGEPIPQGRPRGR